MTNRRYMYPPIVLRSTPPPIGMLRALGAWESEFCLVSTP
jgi:hypothetical protein